MTTYTFDMKLFANIEIEAGSLAGAREALGRVLVAMEVGEDCIGGINSTLANAKIIRVGIEPEEGDEPERIEPEID